MLRRPFGGGGSGAGVVHHAGAPTMTFAFDAFHVLESVLLATASFHVRGVAK